MAESERRCYFSYLMLGDTNGDYIGFVDSDDMVLPNMFQILFDSIIRTKADVSFIMHARIGKDTRYSDITDDMLGRLSPGIIWDTSMIKMEGKELSDSDRCDLHAFQIGGLWSGLWRKSVITDNEIKWPIPRYEDNYWGSLILCYIRKISFVNEIGYLYRTNPDSTTNKRNQEYVLDRITIEKSLLQDVKNRQLFYKYFAAWEFIYISRYALNTFLQIEKTGM